MLSLSQLEVSSTYHYPSVGCSCVMRRFSAKSRHLEAFCDAIRTHADHLSEAHVGGNVPFRDRIEARDEGPLCLMAVLFKRNRTDRRGRSRRAVLVLDRLPYHPFRPVDFQ